jgi:hypothetical protein
MPLYYNVHRWYEYGTGGYTRVDPDYMVDPTTQLYYSYARQNPLRFTDPVGLRIAEVDPDLERHLACAASYAPEDFWKALVYVNGRWTNYRIKQLRDATGSRGRARRALDPGRGSFYDNKTKTFFVDTRDPSCGNVVGDLVREITEFWANKDLGLSPDRPPAAGGFGEASRFADPVVERARNAACSPCWCAPPAGIE